VKRIAGQKWAPYADQYYEYDSEQRVTRSVTGRAWFHYTFAYTTSAFSDATNHWKLKIVMTRDDGAQTITYNNYLGQTLLEDFTDGSNHWINFYEYDATSTRQTLHAHPSAVSSYDGTMADLGIVLEPSAGLIETSEYYTSTTATETVAGGVTAMLQRRSLKKGTGGTPIKQSEVDYFKRTASSVTSYPIAHSTVYRDDAGADPVTTSYAYTWFTSSVAIQQRTTTLPVVPTGQNGTNTADTITEIYDEQGQLIWSRDARGFITYRAYDPVTMALIQEIQDVDSAKLSLPSGWTTPAGGGLHLITDYEVDLLGRTTQTLGPAFESSGQTVRTANWTVYLDLADEVRSGSGYALGVGPEYEYTLVNPVSIQIAIPGSPARDSIVAIRGCKAPATSACQAATAGDLESAGRLSAGDCFPQTQWVRWTRTFLHRSGQVIAERIYHEIPESGGGQPGQYTQTEYGYDRMKRRNRIAAPSDTITRMVYDVRSQLVATFVGGSDVDATDDDPTGGGVYNNTMLQVSAQVYDDGLDGGDGNLTQQTDYVSASVTRVTSYSYDFRNRRTATDGEEDFYEALTYDNLNRVTRTDRRNTTAGGNLIARSETKFDNRGQVYQTLRYEVDPSTGTVGNSLTDNYWYDASGNQLCALPAGSSQVTKTKYDGISRPTVRYTGYTTDTTMNPSSVANDVVFEQSETTYDGASHVLLATSRQRWDTATGNGALAGVSSEPKSRDTYVALWYDGAGRGVATADYGTNDNAGPPTRPDAPPDSIALVLVTQTRYNARGEAFETVDAAGIVTHTESDDAGRVVLTIANFVPDAQGCYQAGSEQNMVVERRYNAGGHLSALIAKNPETGDQETQYLYGTSLGDSDFYNNDLLRAEIYPDSSDSNDRVLYGYNRQGQRKSLTDQNGNVHLYLFDGLGRQTADRITTLGDGVDGAVRRIERSYEVRGMVEKITSYNSATSGSVVNQVQNVYNGFGQLINSTRSMMAAW
jgi:hypothetical protein